MLVAARSGGTVADIAKVLFLSDGTVRNYLSSAIGKTGARTRAEAARSPSRTAGSDTPACSVMILFVTWPGPWRLVGSTASARVRARRAPVAALVVLGPRCGPHGRIEG